METQMNQFSRIKEFFSRYSLHATCLFFTFASVIFISCFLLHSYLTNQQQRLLRKTLDERKQIIKTYTKTIRDQATAFAIAPETSAFFSTLQQESIKKVTATSEQVMETLREGTRTTNVHEVRKKSSAEITYQQFLNEKNFSTHFASLFFVNPDGIVLYSLLLPQYIGNNLLAMPYKETALGRSFMRTLLTGKQDISHFSAFEDQGKPYFFLSTPLFKDKRFIGALVIQLTPEQLLKQVTDFSHLGKTGEILLAQDSGERVLYLNKPRYSDKAEFQVRVAHHMGCYRTAHGEAFDGIAYNHLDDLVLTSASYVPDLALGLVVQKGLDEIYHPVILLTILFYIMLLLGSLFLILLLHRYNLFSPTHLIFLTRNFLYALIGANRNFLFLLAGVGIAGMAFFSARHHQILHEALTTADIAAKTKINYVAQQLNTLLYKVTEQVDEMEDHFHVPNLNESHIKSLIKTYIQKNHSLLGLGVAYKPGAFNKEEQLFAPCFVRTKKGLEYRLINDFYDYTLPENITKIDTDWYARAIKNEMYWQYPHFDQTVGQNVITYSAPFYASQKDEEAKQPLGVIVAFIPKSTLAQLIETLGHEYLKQTVIVEEKGTFIYHPNDELINLRRTLFEVTHEPTNIEHIDLALTKHLRTLSSEKVTTYTPPISFVHWRLGVASPLDNSLFPFRALRTQNISFLISLLIFLIAAGLLIFLAFFPEQNFLMNAIWWYSSLVVCATAAMWIMLAQENLTLNSAIQIMHDKATLNTFVENVKQKALMHHEKPPVPIKTGIIINSLDLGDPDQTPFTAYVWQRYSAKKFAEKSPRFTIPHTTKLDLEEISTTESQGIKTTWWKVSGVLTLNNSYKKYPFNKLNVVLSLEPKSSDENLLLIPDLESYDFSTPHSFPWLSKNLNFKGFRFDTSFIHYIPSLESQGKNESNQLLSVQVILKPNVIFAFLSYLLPLIMIFFTLFTILGLKVKDVIVSYSHIAFVIVLLHNVLRSTLHAREILFMEYFFFLCYITILLLSINAIVLSFYNRSKELLDLQVQPFITTFYWPLQMTLWLLITTFSFY